MKNQLTKSEAQVVVVVLAEVIDAMSWDEPSQVYEEGGRVTIALTPEQMIFLASAAVKLVQHEARQ